jgi:hypothetical protein
LPRLTPGWLPQVGFLGVLISKNKTTRASQPTHPCNIILGGLPNYYSL